METKDPLGFLGPLDPRYAIPYFSVSGCYWDWVFVVLGKPRLRDRERLAWGHTADERWG